MTRAAVTIKALVREVRELVEEYPNARYSNDTGCSYTLGEVVNGPQHDGCIIGQAAKRLGIMELFRYGDGEAIHGETVADILSVRLGIDKDDPGLEWLNKVQHEQDLGAPWGQAVDVTDMSL